MRLKNLGAGRYRVYAPRWTGDRRGGAVGYVVKHSNPYRWHYQLSGGALNEAPNRGWYSTRAAACRELLQEAGRASHRATATGTRPTVYRQDPRGRAFGVEIEFYGPSASTVINALTEAGVRVSNIGSYRSTDGSHWELKRDGSLGAFHDGFQGHELASPKLYGEEGLEQVKAVCRVLGELGAIVDRTCGLHVHHDMRGLQAESIKRQVLAFVDRQDIIARLVAPSRRNGGYSPNWMTAHRDALLAFEVRVGRDIRDISYIGPRGNINLQAYSRHGSVELRSHGGTTSYRKIAAWVRFGQKLFEAAEANRTISMTDPAQMLTDIGMSETDKATLLRFVEAARAAEEQAEVNDFVSQVATA